MTRRYRELPAAVIPARTRQAAMSAAAFASSELRTPPPVIRWFEDCPTTPAEAFAGLGGSINMPAPPAGSFEHEQGILGKEFAGVVWLRADMGARRTAEVAMHETLHALQARLMGPAHGRLEWEGREEQARAYESDSREIARTIEATTPYEGDSNA